MTNAPQHAREGVLARIRESTSVQLWIVVAVSIAFFLVMTLIGALDDCGLGPGDGQCGMGPFFAKVFGVFGAIIIFVGAGGRVLYGQKVRATRLRHKRMRSPDSVDPQRDHGAAMLRNRLDDDA